MIHLTRLNGTALWINPLLIETIEPTPDTVITLTNTHKYVVRESPQQISTEIIQYFREIGLIAVNQFHSEQKDDHP